MVSIVVGRNNRNNFDEILIQAQTIHHTEPNTWERADAIAKTLKASGVAAWVSETNNKYTVVCTDEAIQSDYIETLLNQAKVK